MNDRQKMSFEFARDSTKQLLALATGILTVTVAVATVSHETVPDAAVPWLSWAWAALMASLVCGAWALLALTGTLDEEKGDEIPSIYGQNVVVPVASQVLSFLAGTGLSAWAGFEAIRS